jgi:hypothetical protein
MKVYKKLIDARNLLQSTELCKSGHNKFAGYKYFELGDFLPSIQAIFKDVGLVDVISFTADVATMTIFDVEDGSSIVFTSPMGSASLKGCHEVQNIGAVETYQRRYLYTTAMAIVESDALDATTAKEEPKISPPKISVKSEEAPVGCTPQQISSINSLVDQTQSDIAKLCAFFKKPSIALLDRIQANQAIEMLQKKLFDQELEHRSLNSLGDE